MGTFGKIVLGALAGAVAWTAYSLIKEALAQKKANDEVAGEDLGDLMEEVAENLRRQMRMTLHTPSRWQLPLWISRNVTRRDSAIIGRIGRELGADAANDWLCEVLVSTGRYRHAGDGFVQAVA
jgi:hypothetical protein